MTIATGILNVWQHEPAAAADGYAELDADFPGRFLLGIGIGHPEATSDYKHPLATMRAFFDGLDAVPTDRRMAAALGPKMLDLAEQRSLGAHTVLRPARARQGRPRADGRGRRDRDRGRVRGGDRREHRQGDRARVREGLPRPPQLHDEPPAPGYDEAEFTDGGSDRLIDAVIPHGSAEQIAETVRQHLDAGADHVCLQPLGPHPADDYKALAEVLL